MGRLDAAFPAVCLVAPEFVNLNDVSSVGLFAYLAFLKKCFDLMPQDREFIEMEMPHNGQPQSQRPASGDSQSAGSRTPSPSRLTATSPTAKSTSSRKKDRGVHYPPSSPSAAESPANCCPPWCVPLNRNRPGPLLSVRFTHLTLKLSSRDDVAPKLTASHPVVT